MADSFRPDVAADSFKPDPRTFLDSVKDAGSAFWDWTGKPAMDIMGGASRDPARAKLADDTVKGLVHGLVNEPARVRQEFTNSLDAFVSGNPRATLHHLLNAVPLLGKPMEEVSQAFDQGKYAEGVGHLGALLLPKAIDEAPAIAEAATTGGKVVAGAARGAWQDAAAPANLKLRVNHVPIEVPIPVPAIVRGGVTGAAAGESLGRIFHAPPGAGAVVGGAVGAAVPVVKGAIRGGAEAYRLAKYGPAPEAAWESTGPLVASGEAAPVAAMTPGQALAAETGADWAQLSPTDQAMLEQVAKAQQNTAAQQAVPRPPMGQATPTQEMQNQPTMARPQVILQEPIAPQGRTLSSAPQIQPSVKPAEAPAPALAAVADAPAPVEAPIAPGGPPVRGPDPAERAALNRALHAIAGKKGLSHDQLSDSMGITHGVKSMKELSVDQMKASYRDLTGQDWGEATSQFAVKPDPISSEAPKLAQAMHDHGISLEDANGMDASDWQELAKAQGVSWKAGDAAVLPAETLFELRKLEAQKPVKTVEAPAPSASAVDAPAETPPVNPLQAAAEREQAAVTVRKRKLTPKAKK